MYWCVFSVLGVYLMVSIGVFSVCLVRWAREAAVGELR